MNEYKTLYECYKKPSINKQRVYNLCEELKFQLTHFKWCKLIGAGISSYNTFRFIYKIHYYIDNTEYLYIRTKEHDRLFIKIGNKWIKKF